MRDNGRLQASLLSDTQVGARLRGVARGQGAGRAARLLRLLLRGRVERATRAIEVGRMLSELQRTSERHAEQIERLEDLVRELVLTVEALRRTSRSSLGNGD